MIVNEIAKFWKPLQLRFELLLVAELGEALGVPVALLRRRRHMPSSRPKGLVTLP